MIGTATQGMLPGLKAIWRACFGDGERYTDYIFDHLLSPHRVWVASGQDSQPQAMLCVQPFELAAGNRGVPAAYVFGVATAPEHQGKGLSTRLLEALHDDLSQRGMALSALVPAGEGLFRFYEKRGYETGFHIVKRVVRAGDIPAGSPCELTVARLEDLVGLREQAFGECGPFARWPREYLSYIGAECVAFGGEVLSVRGEGGQGYAVSYREGERVVLKEFACPGRLGQDALAALHRRYGGAEYLLYLPAEWAAAEDKVLPFGMVRWFDREKQMQIKDFATGSGYIAHVLD